MLTLKNLSVFKECSRIPMESYLLKKSNQFVRRRKFFQFCWNVCFHQLNLIGRAEYGLKEGIWFIWFRLIFSQKKLSMSVKKLEKSLNVMYPFAVLSIN